jgi:hypothetical protein
MKYRDRTGAVSTKPSTSDVAGILKDTILLDEDDVLRALRMHFQSRGSWPVKEVKLTYTDSNRVEVEIEFEDENPNHVPF